MSIEVNFENNHKGIVMRALDTLTGNDLIEVTKHIYSLDAIGKVEYQILDLTEVDRVDVDLPTIRFLAHLDQAAATINQGMYIAVVVRSGLLEALSETWAEYSRSPFLYTKICKNMEAARNWVSQANL